MKHSRIAALIAFTICLFSAGYALADLQVTNISYSPTNPNTGDPVTIYYTIQNFGNIDVTTSQTVIDFGDGQNMDGQVENIPAGQSRTYNVSHVYNTSGPLTIQATADFYNTVVESNETNNTRTTVINIGPAPAPDLVITDLSFSPVTPIAGQSVTITATVYNAGNQAITNNFYVRIDPENTSPSSKDILIIAPLGAGSTTTVSYDFVFASAGVYTVDAVADPQDYITEQDEENNNYSESIAVSSPNQPNLIVQSVLVNPGTPTQGQLVTISATIVNTGSAAATPADGSITVMVNPTGSTPQHDFVSIGPLGTGASTTISSTFTFTAGSQSVTVTTDYDDEVIESNELDNANTQNFTVTPAGTNMPDLIITDLSVSAQTAGQPVTITATVQNIGDAAASNNFYVTIDPENTNPPDKDVLVMAPLAAGASTTASYDFVFSSGGLYTINASIDPQDFVNESNEGNNNYSESFMISDYPLANLQVQSISVSPGAPLTTDDVIITATIVNNGSAVADPADGTISVFINPSDGTPNFDYVDIGPLGPGSSTTASATFNFAIPGQKTVTVVVDSSGEVQEIDETDNSLSYTFDVGQGPGGYDLPDLYIGEGDMFASPSTGVEDGDVVTIYAYVRNGGYVDASDVNIDFLVDGLVQDSTTISSITVGSFQLVTFGWTAVSGIHSIEVYADPADTIMEENETNNYDVDLINVGGSPITDGPDLVVTSILLSDSAPDIGEQIIVTSSIYNQGNETANNFYVSTSYGDTTTDVSGPYSLAAGQTTTINETHSYSSAGIYTVTVTADSTDLIAESNEGNNYNSASLQAGAGTGTGGTGGPAECSDLDIITRSVYVDSGQTEFHSFNVENDSGQRFYIDNVNLRDNADEFSVFEEDWPNSIAGNDVADIEFRAEAYRNGSGTAYIEIEGSFEDGLECGFDDTEASFTVYVDRTTANDCDDIDIVAHSVHMNGGDTVYPTFQVYNNADTTFFLDEVNMYDNDSDAEIREHDFDSLIAPDDYAEARARIIAYNTYDDETARGYIEVRGHFSGGEYCSFNEIPSESFTAYIEENLTSGTTTTTTTTTSTGTTSTLQYCPGLNLGVASSVAMSEGYTNISLTTYNSSNNDAVINITSGAYLSVSPTVVTSSAGSTETHTISLHALQAGQSWVVYSIDMPNCYSTSAKTDVTISASALNLVEIVSYPSSITMTSGTTKSVPVQVRNNGSGVAEVNISFDLPYGWTYLPVSESIASGKTRTAYPSISVPSSETGTNVITLKVLSGTQVISKEITVNVSKVTLQDFEYSLSVTDSSYEGEFAYEIELTVRNNSPNRFEGEINLELPLGWEAKGVTPIILLSKAQDKKTFYIVPGEVPEEDSIATFSIESAGLKVVEDIITLNKPSQGLGAGFIGLAETGLGVALAVLLLALIVIGLVLVFKK